MVKLRKDGEEIELETNGAIDAFVSAGWEVVESKDDKKDDESVTVKVKSKKGK